VSELLEPLHQVPLQTVGVEAVEIISAKIVVVALVLLQVIEHPPSNGFKPITALMDPIRSVEQHGIVLEAGRGHEQSLGVSVGLLIAIP
jgi:hypothetical protein